MKQSLVKQNSNVPVFNFFDTEQFNNMQRVCKMFANSDLVPDMYKISDKNPEPKAMANCMIAIDMSNRIGAGILMIMQNMVVIYGKPTWSSKFLIATVNTCGRYNSMQYRFTNLGKIGKIPTTVYDKKWVNGENGGKGHYKTEAKIVEFDGTNIDNIECVAFTTAKGSDVVLESSPVSIKMAIEEGWYTKAGSKWVTMHRQMLIYRSASFWTNGYAPELSMGMKTTEEMEDIEHTIDIAHEDVSDKVNKEIKDNANKEPLDLGPNAETKKTELVKPTNVPNNSQAQTNPKPENTTQAKPVNAPASTPPQQSVQPTLDGPGFE